jgi:hypothetical protein
MNRKILEMSPKNKSPNNIEQTKELIDDLKQIRKSFLLSIVSFLPGETKVSSICVIPNKGKRKSAAFTAFL